MGRFVQQFCPSCRHPLHAPQSACTVGPGVGPGVGTGVGDGDGARVGPGVGDLGKMDWDWTSGRQNLRNSMFFHRVS